MKYKYSEKLTLMKCGNDNKKISPLNFINLFANLKYKALMINFPLLRNKKDYFDP